MFKLGAILAGLGFAAAVLWGVWNYEGAPYPDAVKQLHKHPQEVAFANDSAFGTFDRASVQHADVTHRHAVANLTGKPFVGMQNAAVLNARFGANADARGVAANHHAGPDTRALANNGIANHDGRGINICGSGNLRNYAAVSANHDL